VRPFLHSLNFFDINPHTIASHNMDQIFHFLDSKGILGFFDNEAVIFKELEDFGNMLKVGFPICTIDEDVIKQDKEKQSKIRFENFIHEDLDCRRGITNSKRHNQEFIMAFTNAKNCFRNVFLFHPNLMVARVKIQFGELLSSMKFIE
jgi:hypothetical protein